MNNWTNKDRSETDSLRMSDRKINNKTIVQNPALGINIYKNAIGEELCQNSIKILEETLNSSDLYSWQSATVTESDNPMNDARYCLDFKIGQGNLGPRSSKNKNLYDIHENLFQSIYPSSQDYGAYWGVGLRYFEAFNFVKYESPGRHFDIHVDHGPAYISTVSIVAYLNDDYEGGELFFPRFNLNIKPSAGDVAIFPSTYIYEHSSRPMVSGTKYSVVIMTDYNDRGGNRYYPYREFENKLIY